MYYGLAWYRNKEGERINVIIRDLKATDRIGAVREARRAAMNSGFVFEGVYLAANHRHGRGGEIKLNYTLPRERARDRDFAAMLGGKRGRRRA